jgi:predicted TIM-barrel fold metal-dependent hydrolase
MAASPDTLAATLNKGRIIDIDTHVVEPYDLWTSRMSRQKYGDLIPHVRQDPATGEDRWFLGGKKGLAAAGAAQAGWHEFPPSYPKTLGDAATVTWNAPERLQLMDEYGIQAQILFPNVVLFDAKALTEIKNEPLLLDAIRAYNDWQSEWSSAAPDRLLPQTLLPFWNLGESTRELKRCHAMGHRGLLLTHEPHHFGQPKLTDTYWDPLWSLAQEMEMPINFHIGAGDGEAVKIMHENVPTNAVYASFGVLFFLGNASAIVQLICGGICHRFPKLNFISVESGIGWLPFLIAALDWQWKGHGVREANPKLDLLPSEYFRRQIYGSFWFEPKELVHSAIEFIGPDNILYETDFPHPTSMSPGPASPAQRPPDYISEVFAGISQDKTRRILHDNAARLYKIF